jgi:hypothetical protein
MAKLQRAQAARTYNGSPLICSVVGGKVKERERTEVQMLKLKYSSVREQIGATRSGRTPYAKSKSIQMCMVVVQWAHTN